MTIKEIISELINFSYEKGFKIEVTNEEDQNEDIKKITLDLSKNELIFD